ncbi:DUF1515 domain-containing protein [Rhizobium sp. WSM1325]|uniref:DUF1515 domain-containing protein n=1 Tax=Rhizobium sp. WSM1325 TaxID=3444086 RepID=UPI000FF75F65|nr:DUF1515 domain-containing protein [Rhizobium leguminosarum]RWY68787.1 DUF1515 domain-containing protein [Rhizobium leguminosarum]
MASNDDTLRALGRVEGRLTGIEDSVSHLREGVSDGNVDGQIREEIKTLKDTVEKNHEAVAPTLEEWKKMKTLGYGISGLIAFAGLTIGGIIAYASDGAVAALRHWLKIN